VPNCRDEQVFLTEFIRNNPGLASQMSVACFSFERNKRRSGQCAPDKIRTNWHTSTEIVRGTAQQDDAARMFPVLDQINAFPTMIVLTRMTDPASTHRI
jgi:hypothetical protein